MKGLHRNRHQLTTRSHRALGEPLDRMGGRVEHRAAHVGLQLLALRLAPPAVIRRLLLHLGLVLVPLEPQGLELLLHARLQRRATQPAAPEGLREEAAVRVSGEW